MSRKRRKPVSKKPYKSQKTIIILAEGETEKSYLMYLRYLYNKSINLKIINKSKLTKDISDDINFYAKIFNVDKEEIVLVYDLENSQKEYEKFIENNKLRHKNTYLVQSCIETHFLMHYKNAAIPNDEVVRPNEVMLRLKYFSDNKYHKGPNFNWGKHGIGFREVNQAKYLALRTFNSLNDKSFSMIGKLIVDYFE